MSELDRAAALMFPAFGGKAPKVLSPESRALGRQTEGAAPAKAQDSSRKTQDRRAGEDAALIEELLAFVDGVGFGREVAERLPNPLHYGVVTKTGGTLRGQLRIYSIAAGRVGRVTFKDRTDERDHGDAVRNRIALWNKKQGG